MKDKMKKCLPLFILIFFLYSCSPAKVLGKAAKEDVINSGALINAHIGISVFEPATGKWWYNYQGDKYFVPASNTKLPTCYAVMKYLGDSLVGLKYLETDTAILIQPTADPTLLHRDYKVQPVFTFLKSTKKPLIYIMPYWQSNAYGRGWNWDDYNESYAPERSSLPIYGNVAQFNLLQEGKGYKLTTDVPFYKYRINELVDPLVKNIQIKRRQSENLFDVEQATAVFTSVQIPFITYENHRLLEDTLNSHWRDRVRFPINTSFKNIYSQHSDSLFKPMMHRSDNFFAEQS
ncbi:MAG TPA: D-alanyl-D-alanine carboxypeptidase, partial [Chitinophagaceae bacterium]|nr:D-alanyl-D-alanine carboxypeptidase [Chitinophagaceae bacterium]